MRKKKHDELDLFADDKLMGSPRVESLPVPATIKVGAASNVAFTFNAVDVLFNDERLVNLTQMWKAAGSPANKDPREWRRKEGKGFIADLAKSLDVAVGHIAQSAKGGKGGGGSIHAHWQISLAYAKYLSHEFHRFVNDAFKEWAQEKVDPELKADRAFEGMKRKFGEEKATARWNGVPSRKKFCAEIKKRSGPTEGKYIPFQTLTNAVYIAVTGKNASEIKAGSGLNKSDPARDALSVQDLTMTQYAEEAVVKVWDKRRSIGNKQCYEHALPVLDLVKEMQERMASLTGRDSEA